MPKRPCHLRPIEAADLPALATLHAGAFAKGWDVAALAGLLAHGAGLVACDAERSTPIGFALWQQVVAEADVLTIVVAPAARRQGVGQALLAGLLSTVAETGGEQVFLEVSKDNQPARRLYERAGFEVIGLRRNYYTDKPFTARDALTLRKTLPPRG